MGSVIALLTTTIDERTTPKDLERIRRNQNSAIAELQARRELRVVKWDLALPDNVPVAIAHGLGRRAFVSVSPVRGAGANGRIEQLLDTGHDQNQYVVIRAQGFGGPVTVDVGVA